MENGNGNGQFFLTLKADWSGGLLVSSIEKNVKVNFVFKAVFFFIINRPTG
jgi:hypothetical protein